MDSIFKHFKHSIETIAVKKQPRGTYDTSEADYIVYLKAIVKRRNSTAAAIENSEDRNNNTTIHFMPKDKKHIQLGYYAQIDGNWHSIEQIKDGKNFHTGKTEFLLVEVANDIEAKDNEPDWSKVESV